MPTALSSGGGLGDVLSSVIQSKAAANTTGAAGQDLLASIRAGKQLKRVDPMLQRTSSTSRAHQETGIAAVLNRRLAIQMSDEEMSDEDDDEEDWDDGDDDDY